MKIDPTGRLAGTLAEPVATRVEQPAKPATDALELSGRSPEAATYNRVPTAGGQPLDSSREAHMAQDARAQKLAEVRLRMEAGVYNSREVIEKVVDRLLDAWKLGPAGRSDSSA